MGTNLVQTNDGSPRESIRVLGFLTLFATILAFVTSKHEMYLDEVQPWLFVRNAHSLLPVIQHLRYEAHPALWFILLYGASIFSVSVFTMQWVNFLLAVTMAWLILSARTLPMLIRVLLVFGVSVFFTTGVVARDYMLAGMLLVAATRCLLAKPQRHWLGIVLLGLAINSHFLAIPVATSIFVWFYWLAPEVNNGTAFAKLKESKFWTSVALMGIAVIACYFSVRPARDIATHLEVPGANFFQYFVLGVGRIWHYYLPLTADTGSSVQNSTLALPAFIDVLITLLFWLVAISVLPGRRSRYFMMMASVLWTVAAVATVHVPLATHSSFVPVSYIIALMVNRPEDQSGSWMPSYAAQPILLVILSIQVLICAQFCIKEWSSPFSAGKPVADWLKSAGLAGNPLVVQPELPAPTVLAYTGLATAYFPACQCSRPFVLYSRGWDSQRQVTLPELQALRTSTGLSPVVLSSWPLTESVQRQLELRFVYQSPKGWGFNNEDVTVYAYDDIQEQSVGKR
jgi:hypothetical protein